jgi:two-component system cell cycle sensor histidine kinase/response regulator CckA
MADEKGRLEALHHYKVLETPPEGVLDDLTRIAAYVCQTPIALLTFVDAERQWSKSRIGLSQRETPRRLSFCAHAIHATDLYVVEDTLRHESFADHPLVIGDPHIRFYAGAPLRTPDGHAIGALEVADAVPRQLTPEQLDALRVIGRQVMAQLELRRQALERGVSAGRGTAEDGLREPSVQLDAALEVAGMDVWFTNLRTGAIGRIRRGGPVSRLPAEVTPKTSEAFMALVHEGDRAGLAARIDQATRDGVYSAEFRIVLPDGEVRWVSTRGRCLYDADGTPSAMTGVDLDITERKRDEEQRRAAEDRFRQLAEAIQQVFWMTDARGALLYVSPAFETIFGRSCESLAATPGAWMDAVHPDDRERVEQAAYVRLRRGAYDEVYRIVRPDGAVRWIRDRAFHMYDDAGELYRLVGAAADITEQRQLEEQLQQAQKMEIVGRLAGGVAHDFNNLLTVINGMADLVLAGMADDDPVRRDLTQIRLAGDRAAALTGRLLAISRRQILKPEIVDLSAIADGLRDMIQRLLGEDIALVLELAPDLAGVKADPGQIEQVVLNLVVNAVDAMPDGGVLTIETRTVHVDAVYAAEHPGTRPGPHAMLAVRDTGVGMDESVRRRVFEPFFTTKTLGKGTGLGLSMVYGIVKQSGGSIWFQSEPGHGSRFTIYLPYVTGSPAPRPAPPAAAMARGHETVLVVEDEPPLRDLAARILASAGYTVLQAASGADALALLERHAEPVHLVFTDVVMPGMNGRELAARLATLRPAIRVLYTSGYTEDAILRHGVLDDPARFLSKPYTPSVLRRRIREALDS